MLLNNIRLCLVGVIAGIFLVGFASTTIGALEVPAAPRDVPILDQTNTITEEQKSVLARQVTDERTKSGNQIAIVIIPSLKDESLEQFSLDIARKWGIGTKESNNGVLLLVSKEDRKVRIEVGTGLEGALTDLRSGQIIRNDIAPRFQKGQYYEGIQAGLTSIIASIHGEYKGSTAGTSSNSIPWELIFISGAVILSWLGSILARTKSWWAGGVVGGITGGAIGLLATSLIVGLVGAGILIVLGLIFDKIVSANYRSHSRRGEDPSWWAGGGFLGGGGSDGGFGGFGGGSFGGGGSSGSW